MFNLFKNKKREIPPFNDLKNSLIKDKYFYRLAIWDWLNNDMIHVIDPNAPRMITMDPWPQIIYLSADGKMTIYEFVYFMASQYSSRQPIPEELDKTILEMIDSLLSEKLIELSDLKKELPERLKKPLSEVKQNL
jgi:hypothetical protein